MPTTDSSPEREFVYDYRNPLIWGISDARADSRRTRKVLIPLPLNATIQVPAVSVWAIGRRYTDRVKRKAQA